MSNQKEKMNEELKNIDEIMGKENFNSSGKDLGHPQNYFEDFSNHILELSKLDSFLQKSNLKSGMNLPKDYFLDLSSNTSKTLHDLQVSGVFDHRTYLHVPIDYFSKNVDRILSNKSINVKEKDKPRTVRLFKSWYYAVAAMLILGITGWWYQNSVIIDQDHWSQNLTEEELFDYVIQNAEDYSLENLLELVPVQDLNVLGLGEDDYLNHINEEDLNL